ELAPLAGHYPAVRLGPPWWFFDSMEGMRRFRERTTETAGIYKPAGFTDDTRAFCSIPARHDLARRVDAEWLEGLAEACGEGAERARVVGKAGGVVDPRGLRDALPEARHALDRVMKPPRRAEQHGGVVARERRELAAVGGLVEGEHDETKAR